MAQRIKFRRSSVAGRVPTTSSLSLGELAINTADGKLFFQRGDETIQSIFTTNTLITGSFQQSGSDSYFLSRLGIGTDNPLYDLHIVGTTNITGSLFATDINATNNITVVGTLSASDAYINNWGSISSSLQSISQSAATIPTLQQVTDEGSVTVNNITITGSLNTLGNVSHDGDLTVTGVVTAQEFKTEFVSASIIYQSGSTKFGDTSDDRHSFTGSLEITGSIDIAGSTFADKFQVLNSPSVDIYNIGENGVNSALNVNGSLRTAFIGHVSNTNSNRYDSMLTLAGYYSSHAVQKIYTPPSQSADIFTVERGAGNKVASITSEGGFNSVTSSYFATSGGNVGIGTTVPTRKLHVEGSSYLKLANNSFLDFTTPINTQWWITDNDAKFTMYLQASRTGTYRLRTGDNAKSTYFIQNRSGSLFARGGASYPDIAPGSALLELRSTTEGLLIPRTDVTSNISTPAQGLLTYLTSSANEGIYYFNSGSYQGWTRVLNDSGSQVISGSLNITGSEVALVGGSFSGSGANLYDIPASGIVGLNLSRIASGSATASISPDRGFEVNVDSHFTGSVDVTGQVTANYFYGNNGGWFRGSQFLEAGNVHTLRVGYGSAGQFQLQTGNGAYDVLRATNTGLVGIGTTSPTAKLHVYEAGTTAGFLLESSGSSASRDVFKVNALGPNSDNTRLFQIQTNGTSVVETRGNGLTVFGGNYADRVTSNPQISVIGTRNVTLGLRNDIGYNSNNPRTILELYTDSNESVATFDDHGRLVLQRRGNSAPADGNNDRLLVSGSGRFTDGLRVTGSLSVEGGGTFDPTGATQVILKRYGDSVNANEFVTAKARGTKVAPTAVQNGDYLGGMEFHGYDGSAYVRSSFILPIVTGSIASGDVRSNLYFSTRQGSGGAFSYPMVITSDKKVGINNTTPTEALDVTGNIKATSLLVGDGSSANPSITFYSENGTPNTGIYRIAENELGIDVGGVVWDFDANKLENDNVLIRRRVGTAAEPNYSFGNGYDDNGMFRPIGENTVAFSTAGTEKLRIDGSGNVGIGTISPAYKLDVSGSGNFTDGLTVSGSLTASFDSTSDQFVHIRNEYVSESFLGGNVGIEFGYGNFGSTRLLSEKTGDFTPDAFSSDSQFKIQQFFNGSYLDILTAKQRGGINVGVHTSNQSGIRVLRSTGNSSSTPLLYLSSNDGDAFNSYLTLNAESDSNATIDFDDQGTFRLRSTVGTGKAIGASGTKDNITILPSTDTIVIGDNLITSGSAEVRGGLTVTGSINHDGDLTVTGTVTAQEFKTEFVSASIIYRSGSTKFGDTLDDQHSFTGSVEVTGSLTLDTYATNTGDYDLTIRNRYVGQNQTLRFRASPDNSVFGPNIIASKHLELASGGSRNIYLSPASSKLMTLTSTGNVGIGTESPSYKLTVAGHTFLTPDNSHVYFGNQNTFVGERSNSNQLELRGGGSTGNETLYLDSSGRLGFGTSSPTEKITVKDGNILVDNAGTVSQDANLTLKSHANGESRIIFRDQDGTSGSLEYINQGSSDRFRFGVSGSAEALTITKDGNVGIGTSTPEEKLSIGDGNIQLENNQQITWSDLGDGNSGRVYIRGNEDNDWIQFTVDNNNAKTMRWDTTGLGLGTVSPTAKLDVIGDVKITGSLDMSGSINVTGDQREINILGDDGQVALKLNDANAGATDTGKIGWYINGTLYGSITAAGGSPTDGLIIRSEPNRAITFKTNGNFDRMIIQQDGNVGIGNNTPSEALTVEGNISASGDLYLDGAIFDSNDTSGSVGQILTSIAGGTAWENVDTAVLDEVQNIYATVKNTSGTTLYKGTPVHAVSGSSSGNVNPVIAASASVASTMPATFILNEDLADEAEGQAIIAGRITQVDTSAFEVGDVVYVGESGGYTNVKPTGSGNLIQNLGVVTKVHASNGSGVIYGSGRSNDVPNLPVGKIWVGSENYSVTSSFVHLDEANGRLGIGTTSPSEKLHVAGNIKTSGRVYTNYIYSGDSANYILLDNANTTKLVAKGNFEFVQGDSTATRTSLYDFSSTNLGFTGTDLEQAYFKITPAVSQSGTAAYKGLMVDVTETSTGDGSVSDGNDLLWLGVGGSNKFKVTSTGGVRIEDGLTVTGSVKFLDSDSLLTIEDGGTLLTDIKSNYNQLNFRPNGNQALVLNLAGHTSVAKTLSVGKVLGPSSAADYQLDVSGSGRFTDGLTVTGSILHDGDLTVTGTVTAQEFKTEFVSASIIYQSGSTKFGDTADDTHSFTGSLELTGSDLRVDGGRLAFKTSAGDYTNYIQNQSGGYSMEYYVRSNNRAHRFFNTADTGKGINIVPYDINNKAKISTEGAGVRGTLQGFNLINAGSSFLHFESDRYNNQVAFHFTGSARNTQDTDKFLVLEDAGTELMTVLNSGNVGIGRTPSRTLDISGSLRAQTNGYGLEVNTNGTTTITTTSGVNGLYINDSSYSILKLGDYRFVQGRSNGTLAIRDAADITAMHFASGSRNVGIGTTSPSHKLHVVADEQTVATIESTTSQTPKLRLRGTDREATIQPFSFNSGFILTKGYEAFNNGNGDTNRAFVMYNLNGTQHYGSLGVDSSSNIVVHSNFGNHILLDASGSVGIGTTTPTSKLHISGTNDVVSIEGSGSTILDIQGSQGQLFSVVDSLSGSLMSVNDISGLPILEVFSDDTVVMGEYGTNALVVTGSKVGIGTDAPSYPLEVAGDLNLNSGGINRLRMNGDNILETSTNHVLHRTPAGGRHRMIANGTETMTILSSGVGIGTTSPAYELDVSGSGRFTGNLTVEGSFTELSAQRFKENITPLTGSLDKVIELEGVTYNKIGEEKQEIGLIAEQVASIYPEFVEYDENGQTIGVQYSRLTSVLIEGIKELDAKVKAQELFIKDIVSRIEKLESK